MRGNKRTGLASVVFVFLLPGPNSAQSLIFSVRSVPVRSKPDISSGKRRLLQRHHLMTVASIRVATINMTRTSHKAHPTPAFPVYAVDWTDDDTLILAGGGGATKSGIKNKLVSRTLPPSLKLMQTEIVQGGQGRPKGQIHLRD